MRYPIFLTSCLVAWLLTATTRNPALASGDAIEINLSTKGNDIAFDQATIQIVAGQSVRIRFINQAALSSEIQHNIAILRPGSLDAVIKALQKGEYEIEKLRSDRNVIAMTRVMNPGSEEVLEITLKEPGVYPYICMMAGHADIMNMKGLINVVTPNRP